MRIQNEALNIKIVGGSVVKGDKGDQGLPGIQGIPGMNGIDGKDGRDGVDGRDGIDGKDGRGIKNISLIDTKDKTKIYRIEYTDGTHFDFEVKDGEDGTNGKDGVGGGGAILRGAEKTSRKTNDYTSSSEATYPSSKALNNAVTELTKKIEESCSKQNVQTLKTTDSITLTDGYIYNGEEQIALTIDLPDSADVSFLCDIEFSSGNTATTVEYPNTIKWIGDDVSSNVFIPVSNKRYSIICYYNVVDYVCVAKGVV